MHGSERRTNQPIDVPDDRPADGGRRDIQVILMESAVTIRRSVKDRTQQRCVRRSVIVT